MKQTLSVPILKEQELKEMNRISVVVLSKPFRLKQHILQKKIDEINLLKGKYMTIAKKEELAKYLNEQGLIEEQIKEALEILKENAPKEKQAKTRMPSLSKEDIENFTDYERIAYGFFKMFLKGREHFKCLKESNLEDWTNTVRRMIEIDGAGKGSIRTIAHLRLVYIYLNNDNDFWKANCFSMDAVRKHYDKIYNGMLNANAEKKTLDSNNQNGLSR